MYILRLYIEYMHNKTDALRKKRLQTIFEIIFVHNLNII